MKAYLIGIASFLVIADSLMVALAHKRFPLDAHFASAALCLDWYLALFFLLGHRQFQSFIETKLRQGQGPRPVFIFLLSLVLPYLIYVAGTDSFHWLAFLKLVLYVLLPALLFLTLRRFSQRLLWQDALVILVLWLPLDFRWMRDVWVWPNNSLAYSFNSLLASCLGVFLFVCLRQLQQVGYRYDFESRDWVIGLRNFLLFAPIAITIGIYTGFIALSQHFAYPWELVLSAAGIFIFIAIPEELLFRGIIQNFAERSFLKPTPALIVTSLIFGAAHLNNGPKPDWRYFLLASIAGLFYGNAYTKTRKLLAPAIVHTLVDAFWRGFFKGT